MSPWLSPIRTFPADAQIVVMSGFCSSQPVLQRESNLENFGLFGIIFMFREGFCIEETEMSPLQGQTFSVRE